MRFAPAAAALSLALALTASVSWGAQREPAPRAAVLIAQGDASMKAGDTQAAIDAYEAALTVDPAYTPLLIHLAEAARQEQLQGKAIRYYREALLRDPRNVAAIAGEGEALVEKARWKRRGSILPSWNRCAGADALKPANWPLRSKPVRKSAC